MQESQPQRCPQGTTAISAGRSRQTVHTPASLSLPSPPSVATEADTGAVAAAARFLVAGGGGG
eukprot:CAMPEP_0195125720 /NCGR_PEP_ID=MMETSP0448-20130528/133480_1 /TAXON_ID=66468 /ORGANISM="Heterocapsa triquestra, Strain CCMP 448" /LENGTH=62 /DNA_ID=CAMNT_0040163367 /DNA_START=60 /DNA_END=245 /DNA_ORIENTATION=-